MRRLLATFAGVAVIQIGLALIAQAWGIGAAWSADARTAIGLVLAVGFIGCLVGSVWVAGAHAARQLAVASVVALLGASALLALSAVAYQASLGRAAAAGPRMLAAVMSLGASGAVAMVVAAVVVGCAFGAVSLLRRGRLAAGH